MDKKQKIRRTILRFVSVIGLAVVIGLAAVAWEQFDVGFRIGLLAKGIHPFTCTEMRREAGRNADEVLVMQSYALADGKPALVAAERNGYGAWRNFVGSSGDIAETKWYSQGYDGDYEVNYLYYGENAVGEVYLKDGQLPEAFQDVIVQNGTCYAIKLTLNGRDRGDLAWNIPAALRENGCIPAEDE